LRARRRGGASGGGAVEDGWSTTRDFNTGTIGVAANSGGNGFDDIAGDSRYTTEQVYAGAQACKMTIPNASEGNGTWGGAITFPSTVAKGGDVWVRQYIWMPTNPTFRIETPGNGSLKYMRVRQKTSGASNAGYFDLQFFDDSGGLANNTFDFRMIKEGGSENWQNFGANNVFPRAQWVEHIMHLKLDNQTAGEGGSSRIRFWQNGAKLVDSTTLRTLINATDYADSYYLFTYWNGTSPQAQSLYIDDITVSSNTLPSWAVGLP
jgi:hypothetical protein